MRRPGGQSVFDLMAKGRNMSVPTDPDQPFRLIPISGSD
jgi:hypothetical protein